MPGDIKRKRQDDPVVGQRKKDGGSNAIEWTQKQQEASRESILRYLRHVPQGERAKHRDCLTNLAHCLEIRYCSTPGKLAPQELDVVFLAILLRGVAKRELDYVMCYGISDDIKEKLHNLSVSRMFLFECYHKLLEDEATVQLAREFWAGM